jgi:fructose-1,6-bisphosphatase/inositol monophosphatase family enzyme
MLGMSVVSLAKELAGEAPAHRPCLHVAAAILVTEAGGVCYDMKGGPLDLYSRNYVFACNEAIAQAVLKCVVRPLPCDQS